MSTKGSQKKVSAHALFSTYGKFSEKLRLLAPWYTQTRYKTPYLHVLQNILPLHRTPPDLLIFVSNLQLMLTYVKTSARVTLLQENQIYNIPSHPKLNI